MNLRYLSSVANNQARKVIDNNTTVVKKVVFVFEFSSFLPAIWLFGAFAIVKNKMTPVFHVSGDKYILMIKWHHSDVNFPE